MKTTTIPGVTIETGAPARWHRRGVVAVTVIPFVGFLYAVVSLWGTGLRAADAVIFLLLYATTGIGITVGYHRLLTHRSFEAPHWVRLAFAVAGSMAIQGSVIEWVADHRRHHAYSDRDGDPHSPHLDEAEGWRGIVRGLWHAHMGWLFTKEHTDRDRWAPDLQKDAAMVRVDRSFPLLILASFVLPALLGLLLTWSWRGAFTALLWGGLVRIFLLHHVTWSVNSICHFYGRRPFSTTDHSTNNWPLSLISFGESWHNNHHAFPSSAVHGIGRWQWDLSAAVIVSLEKIGLARDVKRPSEKQLTRKVRSA